MVAPHRTRGLAALALAFALAGLSGPPALATPPDGTVVGTSPSVTAAPSDSATLKGDKGKPGKDRCPQLQLAANWSGDNARLIQDAIDKYGRCSWRAGNPPQVRPYAVFDWDNTVVKNDISDQTIFWMLRNDKILQPPGRNWHNTSRYMTVEGAVALRRACGALAKPGQPLPTSTNVRCADEILSVRKTEKTTDGKDVFYGENQRYMEAMYAWVGQIMQGYTPAEARAIAAAARVEALNAPIGAKQQVGSSMQTAWVRYYPEMKDLIRTLKLAGIEPWIVSASPKEFADAWGPEVGVDSAHTIGVSQVVRNGKLTGHLKGCGGLPNGSDAIMPYIDGKRCFINQIILGVKGARALRPMPASLRPVLAGGDATTDVSMVLDAVGVHVVLNRNKAELMCQAYDNADKRWAVNPMFIEPLPKMEGTYPCSTTAYTDAAGNPGPVRRANGSIIPDQVDTVFGARQP
ncbi:MAG: haloacid dehalogenase-like hydrolase [Arachnia sp.]